MSKRGLPESVQMRHDFHYVEELTRSNRPVGKIIPIDRIEPNPEQPRVEFGDLTELADSIREKGVLEPLLVKPIGNGRWMIIAGERRWRASNLAGLEEVPCIELDIDNESVAEIALIENLQRKDLTIWEEADGLKALADKFGYTQEQIAKKISKSRTTVNELMTIACLPNGVRIICRDNKINAKAVLLEIARQFDEAAMYEHLERITSGKPAGQPSRNPAGEKPKRASGSMPVATSKAFTYNDPSNKFQIDIRFGTHDEPTRRGVLEALKQAFEDVKNDVAEV